MKFQEHQCRGDADSFVAVHEGMILDDMEQVCCGHLENVVAQVLLSETRLGYGNGGIQEGPIAYTGAAAIALNLVSMDGNDFGERQE